MLEKIPLICILVLCALLFIIGVAIWWALQADFFIKLVFSINFCVAAVAFAALAISLWKEL